MNRINGIASGLLGSAKAYIGTVAEVYDADEVYGRRVQVDIEPTGATVLCQVLFVGASDGEGDFYPVYRQQTGLVIVTGNHSANGLNIFIPGVLDGSAANGDIGQSRVIQYKNGLEVKSSTNAALAAPVVEGQFTADFAATVGALSQGLVNTQAMIIQLQTAMDLLSASALTEPALTGGLKSALSGAAGIMQAVTPVAPLDPSIASRAAAPSVSGYVAKKLKTE